MANTITFTRGQSAVTVTPVPGSVRAGGGHDDRGGGTVPAVRAGYAQNGSCQVVMTVESADNMQHTLDELVSLVSQTGAGDVSVEGAGVYAAVKSYGALVDVTVGGDAVQTADITWKGSYNPEGA